MKKKTKHTLSFVLVVALLFSSFVRMTPAVAASNDYDDTEDEDNSTEIISQDPYADVNAKQIAFDETISSSIKNGETHWYKISVPADTEDSYVNVYESSKSRGSFDFSIFSGNFPANNDILGWTEAVPDWYNQEIESTPEHDNYYEIIDSGQTEFGQFGKGCTYYIRVMADKTNAQYSFRLSFSREKKIHVVYYGIKEKWSHIDIYNLTDTAESIDITVKCNKKIILDPLRSTSKNTYSKSVTYRFRSTDADFKLKRRLKKGDRVTIIVESDGCKTYSETVKVK